MKNVLVVLGNGFDLDLGLKTSYINFWSSKKDSIQKIYLNRGSRYKLSKPSLAKQIDQYIYSWGDLEDIIRVHASGTVQHEEEPAIRIWRLAELTAHNNISANEEYFNILKQELISYLEEQQNQQINEESKAAKFLRQLSFLEEDKLNIFNFNYTDINEFAKKININQTFEVSYIHGNLKEKNIILGVGEDRLYEGYGFVLKKVQGAKISPIEEALLQADEIVFYGVSFGFNDFQYFKEFFLAIKEGKLKTTINIYTKDEQSTENIFHRLSAVGVTKRDLYINANLHIEQTMK